MNAKAFLLITSLLIALAQKGDKWLVDANHAEIKFTVGSPLGRVNGTFSGLKANIVFDENDLAGSSINASVDAKTVNTPISLRNRHLVSEETWFNAQKYPLISFTSKQIIKTKVGFAALGDLTIKETTKHTEIPFRLTGAGAQKIFEGEFKINRRDFKLGPGVVASDTVTIFLKVPASKQ